MRFVKAEIEKAREQQQKKNLKDELAEFMCMGVKTVRVIYRDDEYSCSTAAASALGSAAKRHCLPIDVKQANGNVYLVRRDL